MAIRADYHMHSDHSGDSKAPMELMIERAIKCGLSDICFTEHHDIDFVYSEPGSEGMFELNIPKYRADYLRIAPQYADKISAVPNGIDLSPAETPVSGSERAMHRVISIGGGMPRKQI
ncbi:MAG: PHP domain-containing protein, partial [Lachnospiraceae bacterium]|nr:PHP domain-containing protein [Lachnospiraceae bacterium]